MALSNSLSIDALYRDTKIDKSGSLTVNDLELAAEWLLAASGKPWLALDFCEMAGFQQLGVFGRLIASCENTRQALELFQQYQMLLHPVFKIAPIYDDKRSGVEFKLDTFYVEKPMYAEVVISSIPVWYGRLTGLALPTDEVWFRHEEPSYSEKYQGAFNCTIKFSMEKDAIWFDKSAFDKPFLSASPLYHADVIKSADQAMGKFNSTAEKIRQIILFYLPDELGIDQVAAMMHCSERTLQRKLTDENTNFKQLKQEVRKTEAIRLLEETDLTIEQIAFQLGYEQRSSFAAAFLKWTGSTPGKWRENLN